MRIGNLDVLQNTLENNTDLEKLKKSKDADAVAKEFETLFVDMMMKSMRGTVKPDDESNAENIYKSMLDSEYSKNMTDAQSFGIREMVRNWITQNS